MTAGIMFKIDIKNNRNIIVFEIVRYYAKAGTKYLFRKFYKSVFCM